MASTTIPLPTTISSSDEPIPKETTAILNRKDIELVMAKTRYQVDRSIFRPDFQLRDHYLIIPHNDQYNMFMGPVSYFDDSYIEINPAEVVVRRKPDTIAIHYYCEPPGRKFDLHEHTYIYKLVSQ